MPHVTDEPASEAAEITIVIADDHAVVRSGLRMLLEAEEDLEVVAEAGDVPSALRYVRAHRPSVLVLDLNMPGEPSLPAIPDRARRLARTPRSWSSRCRTTRRSLARPCAPARWATC